MDLIDKIFYLNLDRRVDRKEHLIKNCENAGISMDKVERFIALDGSTYQLNNDELKMFLNCDYKKGIFFSRIACNQLGHYNILKEIVKREYSYTIILQDDVIFKDNFLNYLNKIMENFPKDADILNIGLHKMGCGKHFIRWDFNNTPEEDYNIVGEERINEYICKLKNNVNPCSLAYIVTLQGAKELIKYFEKNGFKRATDHNFNGYCLEKNIFYQSLPAICTGNENLGSDIFYR